MLGGHLLEILQQYPRALDLEANVFSQWQRIKQFEQEGKIFNDAGPTRRVDDEHSQIDFEKASILLTVLHILLKSSLVVSIIAGKKFRIKFVAHFEVILNLIIITEF